MSKETNEQDWKIVITGHGDVGLAERDARFFTRTVSHINEGLREGPRQTLTSSEFIVGGESHDVRAWLDEDLRKNRAENAASLVRQMILNGARHVRITAGDATMRVDSDEEHGGTLDRFGELKAAK